ncbi:hypothetical protein HDU76_008191, partial [Blyttiomyces sp. JEL0837]
VVLVDQFGKEVDPTGRLLLNEPEFVQNLQVAMEGVREVRFEKPLWKDWVKPWKSGVSGLQEMAKEMADGWVKLVGSGNSVVKVSDNLKSNGGGAKFYEIGKGDEEIGGKRKIDKRDNTDIVNGSRRDDDDLEEIGNDDTNPTMANPIIYVDTKQNGEIPSKWPTQPSKVFVNVKFQAIDFGKVGGGLEYQTMIAAHTDLMVGLHGAAMIHTTFLNEGYWNDKDVYGSSGLLEFKPPQRGDGNHQFMNIQRKLGHYYEEMKVRDKLSRDQVREVVGKINRLLGEIAKDRAIALFN